MAKNVEVNGTNFNGVSKTSVKKQGGGRAAFKDVDEIVEPVLEPLNANENKTYTPPVGVDGFSSVHVDVPGTSPFIKVTISASDAEATTALQVRSKFKAKIPSGYRSGTFYYAGDAMTHFTSNGLISITTSIDGDNNDTGHIQRAIGKDDLGVGFVASTGATAVDTVYLVEGDEYYFFPIAPAAEVSE